MKIQPISKQETIKYEDKIVQKFWLEIKAKLPFANNKNNLDTLKKCLESAPNNGVICVFSEELSSKTLCESLAKARDNGNRIYILTNDLSNEMKNLEGCLLRYEGGKRIGSFILINPNSNNPKGCLFTGKFSDGTINLPANLLLDLDQAQISVLFRYFCYQFWHKAKKERIGLNDENDAKKPLDIYPPKDNFCDYEYLKNIWGKITTAEQITTFLLSENHPFLNFNNFSKTKIVSIFSKMENNLVQSLKQKQNEIFVHDDVNISLLNTIKTSNDMWLIPKTEVAQDDEIYALLLNEVQTAIIDEHINAILRGKDQYQYYESKTREYLSGCTIFHIGGSPSQKYKINANKIEQLGNIKQEELLPMNEFDAFKPESKFKDDGKSVSITYEWKNDPFTLPRGSQEHPLYKAWEREEESIKKHIDNIRENIKENKKFINVLTDLLQGKQHKISEDLNVRLDELQDIEYKKLKEHELKEKIKEINEIKDTVKKDSGEIKKARLKNQVKEKQNDKKKLEDELEKKIKEIEEEIKKQSADLDELKKQEDKNKDKIKTANEKMKKLNEDKNKLNNKNGELNKKIKNIAEEINQLEKQLNENDQLGQSKELTISLPLLPSKGYLYKKDGKDYLAISDWEDYKEGKDEAKRLDAILCAMENYDYVYR